MLYLPLSVVMTCHDLWPLRHHTLAFEGFNYSGKAGITNGEILGTQIKKAMRVAARGHSSPRSVALVENLYILSRLLQHPGGSQPRHAGTNDGYIVQEVHESLKLSEGTPPEPDTDDQALP
ncbi:hypothetical protein GCM10010082_21380 [Kushneria pakistanensis]|uniref:Uncharacterized protein n=1 Tax=Kushneria pakistanensis TaxID=1508770 RepID=A0ABQ3FKN6_9GAMM|nr:hypothetical protein GCM10010082_21380 [Kushneria pakistanensis]